jgi:hypothetical protein
VDVLGPRSPRQVVRSDLGPHEFVLAGAARLGEHDLEAALGTAEPNIVHPHRGSVLSLWRSGTDGSAPELVGRSGARALKWPYSLSRGAGGASGCLDARVISAREPWRWARNLGDA